MVGGVNSTTHLHLVPRLRLGGAVPPICPGGDGDFYLHLYFLKIVYIPSSCGRSSIASLYTRRGLKREKRIPDGSPHKSAEKKMCGALRPFRLCLWNCTGQ